MISIVLPTRNSIEFLKERVDSIRNQTYKDLEVVVIDTASTDGTLEYLRAWAKEDPRVHIYDTPPGLFQAFNTGIEKSHGEYVYIATSDDSMKPCAMEHMVKALEAHPECDICDSRLSIVDEKGEPLSKGTHVYKYSLLHYTYPVTRPCVRKVPYDLLTYCGGKLAYISLTQILVRKSLYDKIGLFPTNLGGAGDHLWGMRAAAVSSAVYVPEELATWRIHCGQTTGQGKAFTNYRLVYDMVMSVINEIKDGDVRCAALKMSRLADLKCCLLAIKRGGGFASKIKGLIAATIKHPALLVKLVILTKACKRRGIADHPAVVAFNDLYRTELSRILKGSHYDRCLTCDL